MREKRTFAERTKVLKSNEAKRKYFLVYEGKITELLYFDAVSNLKDEIGLNPLIELVPIVRSYNEEGWSNPKKIIDRMSKNIEEIQTGIVSYETLLNWIMDYMIEKKCIANDRKLARHVWSTLECICHDKLGVSIEDNCNNIKKDCTLLLQYLEKELASANLIFDIDKIIKYGKLTYEKDFDYICFIVDRDKDSFTETQYVYANNKCEEKGYKFFVTNPNFEFWLLLHFNDVDRLDKEKLLENPSVSGKKRYTESELKKRIPDFRKSKYDAESLVRKIDTAVCNEKLYCESVDSLKDEIGSNIGCLIQEMRQ